jgi:hypothetical protein
VAATLTEENEAAAGTGVGVLVDAALILVGLVLLAFGQPHRLIGDGQLRFEALNDLLAHGKLSDVSYSLVGPLFATPLWIIGTLGGNPVEATQYYNVLVFATGLLALYLLLSDRIDGVLLRRFLLLLVAGSTIAPNLADFYGDTFTAMSVGVGVVAVLAGQHPATRFAGWAAVVLGVVNTPATLVGLGLVSIAELVRRRRLRFALPLLVAGVLVLGEAWLRRGSPFTTGYEGNSGVQTVMPYSGRPGFSYPFLLGLVAILFSFGKGLVWYLPGLLLPARRRLRAMAVESTVDPWRIWVLWALFLAGMLLVYSRWWAWYGGVYWGPRLFLLAILPASLALAAALRDERSGLLANLAALAALTLSVWVGADSLVFGQLWALICYENSWALESLCHFTPDYSALWYPFVAKPALTTGQLGELLYYGVVFGWLAAAPVRRIAAQVRSSLPTRTRLTGWRW